jgi:endonuclease/exonuclease/phosphatase family metal-dependent hydrolase
MRLGTVNLLHGRSLTDGKVDVERLRRAVGDLGLDVAGLQEVDRNQDRSHRLDLTAEVALGMATGPATAPATAPEHRFVPTLLGTPGASWRDAGHGRYDDDEAAYGIGLVSTFPVREWQVVRLSAAPIRSPIMIPGPRPRLMMLTDEPRALLVAVLDTPAGPLTVGTTHLSFVPGWNVRQLRWCIQALRRLPAPRILLGDLNLPAAMVRPLTRWRSLAAAPTYPADDPRIQFDHVLLDPQGGAALPAVTKIEAARLPVSDHRALVVQLGGS